jgi:6-phosphofructokinase 1
MSDKQITIGVLTSGGDAPGMNAAIRAVVRAGIGKGFRVMGVYRGYNGLVNGDIFEMNLRSVSGIIHKGGTVLYTARCPEFMAEEGVQKAVDNCKGFNLNALVTIGGEGTFCGARELSRRGVSCIGIPGTIDNDVASSEYTIGFDTAVNTVIDMVDRLRDTSESHQRCSVVEVMGRRAGHIALMAGTAVGAVAVLVPEIDINFERDIVKKIKRIKETGRQHFIVLVSEGVGGTESLARSIEMRTGIETRTAILGHVQRGGSPTAFDRSIATRMGYKAIDLISRGIGNEIVVYKGSKISSVDIERAFELKKPFDKEFYKINSSVSI